MTRSGAPEQSPAPGSRGAPWQDQVRQARCVVVKVGSSSLTSASGGLDGARLDALVDALADRWGSEQDATGTTSWFALEVEADGEPARTA